jgi:hypothetical protein
MWEMKITVLTGRDGRIVGTFTPSEPSKDAPKWVGVAPLGEQRVYELEVPERLAKIDMVQKLHESHFVEIVGGTPRLVEYKQVTQEKP